MSHNQKERQHQELEKALKIAGGVTALSEVIKVKRPRMSKWRNQEVGIPYEHKITIAVEKGVNIDLLSFNTPEQNAIFKRNNQRKIIEVPIDEITVLPQPIRDCMTKNRPIIIDTNCMLLTGLAKFNAYKAAGIEKIPAIIFDFEALFLATEPIFDIDTYFLFHERVALCLWLEQLIGNHQGQRNDLICIEVRDEENDQNSPSLRPIILDEVSGRKDEKIAKLMKFYSKSTYHNAKQVFSHSILPLITLLEDQIISLYKAFTLSQLSQDEQNERVAELILDQALKRKSKNKRRERP